MSIDKDKILGQLKDLARVTSKDIVNDMSDWIEDDKHGEMAELAERALKLKADALMADSKEKRDLIAEDLEFALARIKTKIETEKIVVSRTIAGHVMRGLKASLSVFSALGEELVSTLVKGAVKGVTGSLGGALSDAVGDAFAQD